jgi:hypothetical protein
MATQGVWRKDGWMCCAQVGPAWGLEATTVPTQCTLIAQIPPIAQYSTQVGEQPTTPHSARPDACPLQHWLA